MIQKIKNFLLRHSKYSILFFTLGIALITSVFFISSHYVERHKNLQIYNLVETKKNENKILMMLQSNIRNDDKAKTHMLGFIKASIRFPNFEISVVEGVGTDLNKFTQLVENAYKEGVRNIFLLGFSNTLEFYNITRKYNDVSFFVFNGEDLERNIKNYSVKIYLEKYYLGMLAGIQSKTDQIGYFMNEGVASIRSLNFFARGVDFVNPKAVIHVLGLDEKYNLSNIDDILSKFIKRFDIDVISGSAKKCYWCKVAEANNVSFIGQYTDESNKFSPLYLGAYDVDFSKVYSYLFSMIINGTINYKELSWFGRDDDVIKLSPFSLLVSRDAIYRIKSRKRNLDNGVDSMLKGPIYSNTGQLFAPADSIMSERIIIKQDTWFYRNVVQHDIDKLYSEEDKAQMKLEEPVDEGINDFVLIQYNEDELLQLLNSEEKYLKICNNDK